MGRAALQGLARLVLTGLLIASLVVAGMSLSALARAPLGAAFVARSSAGIAAATERALAAHATPAAVAARIDALLQEAPRNWLAIEAVEELAATRGIGLPADVLTRRAAAWEADSGFRQGATECLNCLTDAATCSMTYLMICRAPVELSPLGDIGGVMRAGSAYLAGEDVDEVDAILSVIGLSAVTLSVWSGGSSLTLKTGAGFAKLARAMGRLPDSLTAPFPRAFRDGIAWDSWRSYRPGRSSPLLRPDVMRPATQIADDMGRLVKGAGPGGALHLMKYVDDPADLARMARSSDALGPRLLGTVEVLGKNRVMRLTRRLADEVIHALAGIMTALAALLGLMQSLLANAFLRLFRRQVRAPASARARRKGRDLPPA
jgi:hypothetical protein